MSDLPLNLMLERIGNVSRSDAELYCRGKIEKYFDNPIESFFYIKKVDGEWYCEMQEGGLGKAYLPELLKTLTDDNKPDEVILHNGTRHIKAVMDEEDGISFYILNDGDEPELHQVKRTARMTPFEGDSRGFLIISVSCLIMALIILVTSFTAKETVKSYQVYDTSIDQFTSFHRLMNQMERLPEDRFVNKIEFSNSRWSIDIKKREVITEEPEPLENLTEEQEKGEENEDA
jgi:hypothetical protein